MNPPSGASSTTKISSFMVIPHGRIGRLNANIVVLLRHMMPSPLSGFTFYDNVKAQGGTIMAVQKLSSKNQIVIPKEARQAMGVKGGDELLVVVKNNLTIVMPKPKRYARTLRGLAKGTYPTGYLKRERRSW